MEELTFVIADDAAFMRILLKKMIEQVEYYTVLGEACNGWEAITLAEKFKPDIMTLDINMPQLRGIEAIREILRVSPQTRIIMVSAIGQQSMIIDAIKLGAKDFVVKPFKKSHMMQAIKNVMAV